MQLPDRWLFLRTPPDDGARNMALDLVLMREAREHQTGFLRVYGWSVPTVSFGRHEATSGPQGNAAFENAGLAVTRRPTGGRALLHSREVTYSVSVPIADETRWSTAYGLVNERLRLALGGLNIPARIVGAAGESKALTTGAVAAHSTPAVCFSGIAPGEIAVGDRKLVASSVWRERGAYLQHGSILLHDDQPRLTDVIGATNAVPEPAAVLSEHLRGSSDAVMIEMMAEALFRSFSDCGNAREWSIPPETLSEVERVRAELVQPAWLWRR